MLRRRGFIAGLTSLLAAPAIIRTPSLLMPVKVALPYQNMVWISNPPAMDKWADIVNQTFLNRSAALVESLMRTNPLMGRFNGIEIYADRVI